MGATARARHLCDCRIGVFHAFETTEDPRIMLSLWYTIDLLDELLDALAPAVSPDSDVGQYLRLRHRQTPASVLGIGDL